MINVEPLTEGVVVAMTFRDVVVVGGGNGDSVVVVLVVLMVVVVGLAIQIQTDTFYHAVTFGLSTNTLQFDGLYCPSMVLSVVSVSKNSEWADTKS